MSHYLDRAYGRSIVLDTGVIHTLTFKRLTEDEKAMLDQHAEASVRRYFTTDSSVQARVSQTGVFGSSASGSSTSGPSAAAFGRS